MPSGFAFAEDRQPGLWSLEEGLCRDSKDSRISELASQGRIEARSHWCLLGQHTPPPEPSPFRWRAIATSLSIVVALILLPAIAVASPSDPWWIAGIYDGA